MRGQDHTIVVGGGVIGICAAYALVKRGARVTVLERDEIGNAASFGNAGCIAPGHLPINRPLPMSQVLGWMIDETGPIYVSPKLGPGTVKWLWQFHLNCTERHVADCMAVLGPLGHMSQALFDRLVVEEDLACDYRREGYYEIYLTEKAFDAGKREADRLRAYGYAPSVLSGEVIREREPALASAVKGAIWHEEAATCDPHRFVTELAGRARGYGADIRNGVSVEEVIVDGRRATGVRTADGENIDADTIVLATGAYSQHLIRDLGFRLPLQPAKGYHRDIAPREGGVPPLGIACTLMEKLIFCTPMGDFVRLAGTLEFSGLNHRIRQRRLDQLTEGSKAYFRETGNGSVRSEWCGLRPCLPDGLPVVGWVPRIDGLFVANGHAMMGLTLGPITGQLAAESILDGRTSIDVARLGAERF